MSRFSGRQTALGSEKGPQGHKGVMRQWRLQKRAEAETRNLAYRLRVQLLRQEVGSDVSDENVRFFTQKQQWDVATAIAGLGWGN